MHTKLKGDIGELIASKELLKRGWRIAFPYGENLKYDLIAERDGEMRRIQVKACYPRSGSLRVNCCSSNNWSVVSYLESDFEFLAAVNLEDEQVYFIPSSKIRSKQFNLRIDPPKNSQKKKINIASDFLEIT